MNTSETACVGAGDDVLSRLKRRVDLMETTFRRELSDMKRAGADLVEKNKLMESQLSTLQEETEKLKVKVSQLDEENRRLEAAFKLHVNNMDWEYAADPPPNNYWIQQGYNGRRIPDFNVYFFDVAKNLSEQIRRGAFCLNDGDGELCFGGLYEWLPYDPTMLSHWMEFRNSVCNWQFSPVRGTIDRTCPIQVLIRNIEMPKNVLKELRLCLITVGLGHVELLHLEMNRFQGSDGVDFALEIMQAQKKMTAFNYVKNPVYNGQDCQILIDAIVSHPNISSCNLECVCGRDRNGHDYLVDLLRKEGMKSINFANCGVKTNGQSTLFDVIKFHPNLEWLSLDNSNLNDGDAIHLADALRHNRTLEKLYLDGNDITRSGDKVLWKVIYDDSSLNAVADSNHVCKIDGSADPSSVHHLFCCNDGGPRQNRARKIFSLLRERNFEGTNVYHLEREIWSLDTLKVVPFVLNAAQVYGKEWKKKAGSFGNTTGKIGLAGSADLSVTYELLRSWHVVISHDGTAA